MVLVSSAEPTVTPIAGNPMVNSWTMTANMVVDIRISYTRLPTLKALSTPNRREIKVAYVNGLFPSVEGA